MTKRGAFFSANSPLFQESVQEDEGEGDMECTGSGEVLGAGSLSARTRATLCVEEVESGDGLVEVTSPDLGGKWVYSIDNTSTLHTVE